jgi:hypothetical protein
MLAEFAGVALFLFFIGNVLMGLYAHRLFLRAIMNRTFHMQKDCGNMLEQFEIFS